MKIAMLTFLLLTLPLNVSFASANESIAKPDLALEYQNLRKEARQLAGSPNDVPLRSLFYAMMYLESGKRFEFSMSAGLATLSFYQNVSENAFGESLKTATREAFIDNYTNYYFTKKFGSDPQSSQYISPSIKDEYMKMHTSESYPFSDNHKLYQAILEIEQRQTIQPILEEGYKALPKWSRERFKARHPSPIFYSCMKGLPIVFRNFMNPDSRIESEVLGHRIINYLGAYDCLLGKLANDSAMKEFGISTETLLSRAYEIRNEILKHEK
jgi:hypothetical protein